MAIIHKERRCKGIGRAKNFKGCNVLSLKRRYGLCPLCLWEWSSTTKEGKKWQETQFFKRVNKITLKRQREKNKKLKIELTDWRQKLQSKVQEIVRLIDIGQPCLARGYHAGQLQGGHIFAKGGNKTIALNLHNIHRQSAQSNTYGNDDGILREGLIKEYGQGYFDFISELRRIPSLKYSNEEYHGFYKKASQIALKLKRGGKTFGLRERIEKRNEINLELGIYDKEFCVYERTTDA